MKFYILENANAIGNKRKKGIMVLYVQFKTFHLYTPFPIYKVPEEVPPDFHHHVT